MKKTLLQILPHYEKAAKAIGRMGFYRAVKYLEKRDMELGVCAFAKNVLSIDIYGLPWVKKHYSHRHQAYWGPAPCDIDSGDIKELRQTISHRIEIMKQLLKEAE